jgi:hypothetical protein
MSVKNSGETIGNRSCDLPVCSAVPQPLHYRVPPTPIAICVFVELLSSLSHIVSVLFLLVQHSDGPKAMKRSRFLANMFSSPKGNEKLCTV